MATAKKEPAKEPKSSGHVTPVRDLPDEVKTGPIRRREAREERLAGEAELYARQHSGEGE